jgi:putative tryptophan/tyrosine transport system substrate-binding protein
VIDRRAFIGSLAIGLLAAPLAAGAQQRAAVARIGWLSQGSPTDPATGSREAFRQGMRELGYVEGQNIVFEERWAEGKAERLPSLAAELVGRKVDVIVAGGTLAPLAAMRATKTIPIVLGAAGAPVETGLVSSLAKPGGNVTGLSNLSADLTAKRLQLLKEVVPGVTRVAVLWNAANPVAAVVMRETEAAARRLGLPVQSLEVRGPDDFEKALPAAMSGGAGALFVIDDPLVFTARLRIGDFAVRNRLPMTAFYRPFAEAGGLMSFGANLADLFHRAAIYVDKILRGAKPGDLPIEQPTKFELVINLKTAKALGLTIPQSLLQRADQVIE